MLMGMPDLLAFIGELMHIVLINASFLEARIYFFIEAIRFWL